MTDISDRPGTSANGAGARAKFRPSSESFRSMVDASAARGRPAPHGGHPVGRFAPRDTPRRSLRPVADNTGDALRGRLIVSVLVMGLLAIGLVYRLVTLQAFEAERYRDYGLGQRLRTVELPGGRGDLLDRNGEQLATSLPRKTFFTDPAFVTDPITAAAYLSPILEVDQAILLDKLAADNNFQWLARQVSNEVAAEIEALDLDGVFSMTEPTRFKPAGEQLALGLLGGVNIDNRGSTGLEKSLDDSLGGASGEMHLERDQVGNTIPDGLRELVPAQPGSDVVLTLDRPLQFEVERLLLAQVDAMGAKGGVVVVARPGTGEVLAMASVDRDDADTVRVSPQNAAVTWAFEPGSVMKPLTFAAILENDIADPESRITVPSTLQVYDREFADLEDHETVDLSVSDIVVRSSNIGSILWAETLGPQRYDEALRDFGFGAATGLQLPFETSGIMPDVDDWVGTTPAAMALGQGIAVSPAQMLGAFNVLANDGEYVPLRLVSEIVDPDGDRMLPEVGASRRVVSEQTAREMSAILRDVVAIGTGTAAAVDGYEVAGKTGTARKPLPEGGYEDAAGNFRYVSSFVGYLPANDPQISILVSIDEPSASIYASVAAAPTFGDVARYALRHFQIPPSADLFVRDETAVANGSVFIPAGSTDDGTGQ